MPNSSRPPPVPAIPSYPSYTDTGDNVRFMSDDERKSIEGNDIDTTRKVAGAATAQAALLLNPYMAIGSYALSKWDRLKTGKGKEQQMRDEVRDTLWDKGAVGSDWLLKFSDGSAFDIGKDGGARLKNSEGTERAYYEIDDKNPFSQSAMNGVSPLAALITNNDERLKQQFAGYFTNAATEGAQSQAQMDKRISEMYGMVGVTKSAGLASLAQLKEQGRISDEQLQQYSALINKYAPEVEQRSFVDAFLPRGTRANEIARNAVAKMQARMGMDFSPHDNIQEFTLSNKYFSAPAYQTPPTQNTEPPTE